MKPISLFVLGVMAVAMSAPAQAQVIEARRKPITTDPIQKPLLAAPTDAMAKDATVVKWIRNPHAGEKVTAADFTFEVLRSGPGRMVCYDLSGWPGEEPWSVECTSSDANMPRIAQNRAFAEMGSKATPTLAGGKPVLSSSGTGGIRELVLAAAKDGTRALSEVGSIWYNLRGDSQDTAIWHSFIAMPNLKGTQVGLPEVRDAGGAWLMFAGTPEAHVMLPGR
jgi:hypothetical protein